MEKLGLPPERSDLAKMLFLLISDVLVKDLGVKVVDSGFPISIQHPLIQHLNKSFLVFKRAVIFKMKSHLLRLFSDSNQPEDRSQWCSNVQVPGGRFIPQGILCHRDGYYLAILRTTQHLEYFIADGESDLRIALMGSVDKFWTPISLHIPHVMHDLVTVLLLPLPFQFFLLHVGLYDDIDGL
ncbi:hypothetical protein BP00DRAFT_152375 [Aspergillus indologenus CBS 114.80]|uniref:Uncharacterized protein n=1 Tax=Aspergillus indologenus CBS 114.80 TaxID=1450541 RepID=A0A2V5II59_9EURO|nr:hypothetical protein BP00DRAFT_152375 [Aspergillus indologenus CBS 114.80]